MKTGKIMNDPVYGFINIPKGIILDLIEDPWFQRLRRIKQLGLSHYVYPGAMHTRYQHAIGAFHLMSLAVATLKLKGIVISPEEEEAVYIGILLHDIGHGPFSHALEGNLVNVSHEELSLCFMEEMNKRYGGKLGLAIKIFKGEYRKEFLHQLISSQLDMDRIDYLNRDSFFTGVSEGVIGYHRIINMLNVVDNKLVVEEKGLYSIEKFLMSRRLMYWQVYLHKTSVAAEYMLILFFRRLKELYERGDIDYLPVSITTVLEFRGECNKDILVDFARLDDTDIIYAIKSSIGSKDKLLDFVARSIINRKLFKIEWSSTPFGEEYVEKIKKRVLDEMGEMEGKEYLFKEGMISTEEYVGGVNDIFIMNKRGVAVKFDTFINAERFSWIDKKYYILYSAKKNIN